MLSNYSYTRIVPQQGKKKGKEVLVGVGGAYNCTPEGGAPPSPAPCVVHPGARENAYTMVGSDGRLWLFGGSGYAFDSSKKGGMNDLWSYNPSTGLWRFEGGPAVSWVKPNATGADQVFAGGGGGHHGTLGVGSRSNRPGADHAGYFWNDEVSEKLWLMGGENGNTDKTGLGVSSDLWSLTTGSKLWTWESGAAVPDQPGEWSDAVRARPAARYAGQTWAVAERNELWLFGGWGMDASGARGYLSDVWSYTVA